MYFNINQALNPLAKDWKRKSYEVKLEAYKNNCDLMKTIATSIKESEKEFIEVDDEFKTKVETMLSFAK
jgi:uncharacterized protein YukE